MPRTEVAIYAEQNVAPLLEWLDAQNQTVQNKLLARIELLEERGYELRRPHSGTLRNGIHELRALSQRVNYRVLYFFNEQTAVLSHGLTKEGAVPKREIDLAINRKKRFASDPVKYTYKEP